MADHAGQAALGSIPFRIAAGYQRPSLLKGFPKGPFDTKVATSLHDVQRSARARRKAVDASVAEREEREKLADEEEQGEGKWHCDICGTAQAGPCPDAAVGKRYCQKCNRQWEAGWSLAQEELQVGFCSIQNGNGEALGLCRHCGLPLGELTFEDEAGEATLHQECMARLKMLEIQGKERAREQDVADQKKKVREEHGIGWSISMVPCSWGLASKLGCRLSKPQSLCCLALEEGRSLQVLETQHPAASVNLEYLALALQVRLHEGREPLFSLDPVHRTKDLEKSTQVKHFDPEWLMGTTAGEVMFQADYHLKELSMGEYEQPVVGMRSMTDYSEEERAGQGWNAREWFTVRAAEVCKSTDNVLIPRVEMSVEARQQIEGPRGWEDAKVTRADHPLVKFAETFTRNFDLIAERKSVIYHLRELAKASVLAKFLLDSQVNLSEEWFNTVDWPRVKDAAARCSLEIPQLWNDRFHSQVRLHNGASLGKADGVFTTMHSVYGGVQFGLDRFKISSTRQVAATLTARTTLQPMAGLMAETLIGPRSSRHPGPRGVDLNLDKFSLDDTVDMEVEVAAFPMVGKAFWSSLESGQQDAAGEVLKEVFNPFLSDRRGEGDLFIAPDASTSYLSKLKALVEGESKVRHQRQEHFCSQDFSPPEPGPLFPASWAASIKMAGGGEGPSRPLHPYSGDKVEMKDLQSIQPAFDQSTEDGMRFRIYHHGELEVRTVQPRAAAESVGVVFSTRPDQDETQQPVSDTLLIRLLTQYVTTGEAADHRYWLLLETEEDNIIVTEKLSSGEVVWHENSVDLAKYAPGSRAVGSLSCCRAGITVGDMRQHCAAHSSAVKSSAQDCRQFAEDAYSRAWAFSTPNWKPAPNEGLEVTRAEESSTPSPAEVRKGCLASLRRAAAKAQDNPQLVRAAVAADGMGLERATERLREDENIVDAAVRENGSALKFAAESLKANKGLVRTAVAQDALAIQHAAEALKEDEEIARLAVEGNSHAIELVAKRLRTSPRLILASLQRNEFAIEHAPEELLQDRAFMLAAVRRNGRALEKTPKRWKGDAAFMREVVSRNGFALMYASDALRKDAEVVLAALEQDPRAVEYADLQGLGLNRGGNIIQQLRNLVDALESQG